MVGGAALHVMPEHLTGVNKGPGGCVDVRLQEDLESDRAVLLMSWVYLLGGLAIAC